VPGAASDSGYAAQFAVSLADYVQLSLQADFMAASHPSSISPFQRVTAGIRRQRRHSAFTEYVRNNRLPEPVIRVNSQRWRDLA
jgi:hypothetical protein